jgi:hypothetical protein
MRIACLLDKDFEDSEFRNLVTPRQPGDLDALSSASLSVLGYASTRHA